jgi:hypothetical protein
MNWDFESFMDKELWEICEEAERIEKQKQEEREIAQIIGQLQTQEEEQKTIEEQTQTEEVIQTKEEETEEISEVEQETIEETKEENLEFDESEEETKQEEEQKQSTSETTIMFVRTSESTEQSQSKSGEVKVSKIFDTELAIEIAKSWRFKNGLKRYLKFQALADDRSSYFKTYRLALLSDVPGKYIKYEIDIKVKYTFRSKQEVLKLLPPGAYPIIHINQNEIWIAVTDGNDITKKGIDVFAVRITNLDEKIDAIIPSPQIFNLAFLLVYPNKVEYLGVEMPENRDFPIYVRCDENCYWILRAVLESIMKLFVEIMYKHPDVLEEIIEENKESEDELDETEKIIKEVEKRLNSKEYINEIVSVLEKLEENPEYKSFTEEAKSYHYLLRRYLRGYLTEARRKTEVYFKTKESFDNDDELPDGIYLLIFRDMRATSGYDHRTYYVRDKGDNWDIVKIEEENYAIPTVIFELAYLVKYKDEGFYVITKLPYRRFYLYMPCNVHACHWMPPVVFNAIWPVVRKHIRKIMREVLKINVEEKAEEEISNKEQSQTQELTQKKKMTKQLQKESEEQKQLQTKEIKQIENLFNKQLEKNLEIVFCKWNEYVKDAYLLPYITNDEIKEKGVSYNHPVHINGKVSLIRGWAQIIPKPVFLPKQIHIKDPDEIKQIPEGVYPIIRFYQFEEEKSRKIDRKLFFALSPNTEVVFEINQQTEKFLGHLLQAERLRPLSYSPEFAIVWNNTIIFRNLLDFDEEFKQIIMSDFSLENFQYSSSYWVIRNNNGYMYYLPEVLFLFLAGENVKPKEEPFVAEMILNSQKMSQDWYNWVQSISDKYNKFYVDNEKLKTIEFSELHKMPGTWYVKEIKKHYQNPQIYKLDYYELVIVNMRNKERIFKVRANFELHLEEDDVGRVFITVWPDGTIGRWLLRPN